MWSAVVRKGSCLTIHRLLVLLHRLSLQFWETAFRDVDVGLLSREMGRIKQMETLQEAAGMETTTRPLFEWGTLHHTVLYFYNFKHNACNEERKQERVSYLLSRCWCVSMYVKHLRYSIPRITSLRYTLASSSEKGSSVGTSITGLQTSSEVSRKNASSNRKPHVMFHC